MTLEEAKKEYHYCYQAHNCHNCMFYSHRNITYDNGKHYKCDLFTNVIGRTFSPLRTSSCDKWCSKN